MQFDLSRKDQGAQVDRVDRPEHREIDIGKPDDAIRVVMADPAGQRVLCACGAPAGVDRPEDP
jgi:hypothetical protein